MNTRQIYITRHDLARLEELLRTARASGEERDSEHLDQLEALLESAHTVSEREVPADVITLNSRVRLASRTTVTRRSRSWCFPGDADAAQQRIPVPAPMGAALLGCRVGQDAVSETPDGTRRLRGEEMPTPPGAAGDYHLQCVRAHGAAGGAGSRRPVPLRCAAGRPLKFAFTPSLPVHGERGLLQRPAGSTSR